MDIMLILQIIVLFGGIYLGVKLGGMGVGYAGGLGVVILALLGMKVDMKDIPMDVILIIASVISAITALQVAGGLFNYPCRYWTHCVFYDPCYR